MDIYEWGPVQSFIDFKNFFKFKKDINREISVRDSKFNKFGLKRNWLGNIVYVQLDFSDADLMGSDFNENAMVQARLAPIVTYLSSELGWGDYLVPQVSNFVDEDENRTLSYGVLFIFTGYNLTFTKFCLGLLAVLGLLGTGVWALFRYLI